MSPLVLPGALIGAPAGSVRSQRFGTNSGSAAPAPVMLSGDTLRADLTENEESLGAKVIRGKTVIGGAQ